MMTLAPHFVFNRQYALILGVAIVGCAGNKTPLPGDLGLDAAVLGGGSNPDTGFSFSADTFDAGDLDQSPTIRS